MVKGIIHQPFELEDGNVFYAFSYYYDRAVDAGLIGEHTLTHPLHNYTAHLLDVITNSSAQQRQDNMSHLRLSQWIWRVIGV